MSKKFNAKRFVEGAPTRVCGKGGYKNVLFEGYLGSAENEDGKKLYFTVDAFGVGLNSYSERMLGRTSYVNFSLRHKKAKQSTYSISSPLPSYKEFHDAFCNNCKCKSKDSHKPDVVSVVRHFRRWDNLHGVWSTKGGLTAIIDMNYNTMTMNVYPAFCSDNDNFNKDAGLAIALGRQLQNVGIKFKFDRGVSIRDSLTRAILGDFDYLSNDREENDKIFLGFDKCMKCPSDHNLEPIL